jgi:hypothetical protein
MAWSCEKQCSKLFHRQISSTIVATMYHFRYHKWKIMDTLLWRKFSNTKAIHVPDGAHVHHPFKARHVEDLPCLLHTNPSITQSRSYVPAILHSFTFVPHNIVGK